MALKRASIFSRKWMNISAILSNNNDKMNPQLYFICLYQ